MPPKLYTEDLLGIKAVETVAKKPRTEAQVAALERARAARATKKLVDVPAPPDLVESSPPPQPEVHVPDDVPASVAEPEPSKKRSRKPPSLVSETSSSEASPPPRRKRHRDKVDDSIRPAWFKAYLKQTSVKTPPMVKAKHIYEQPKPVYEIDYARANRRMYEQIFSGR